MKRATRWSARSAAALAGFDLEWRGEAEETRRIDRKTGRAFVRVSPEFDRPTEVDILQGDASKARDQLGWAPSADLAESAAMMMTADPERVANGNQR